MSCSLISVRLALSELGASDATSKVLKVRRGARRSGTCRSRTRSWVHPAPWGGGWQAGREERNSRAHPGAWLRSAGALGHPSTSEGSVPSPGSGADPSSARAWHTVGAWSWEAAVLTHGTGAPWARPAPEGCLPTLRRFPRLGRSPQVLAAPGAGGCTVGRWEGVTVRRPCRAARFICTTSWFKDQSPLTKENEGLPDFKCF